MSHVDPSRPAEPDSRIPDSRIPVAILGATGSVGQRFVQLLARHPWFRIAELTASDRSAGKTYGEAVDWYQDEILPPAIAALPVLRTDPATTPLQSRLLFSALDANAADLVEAPYAEAGHFVVSNARSHRMGQDVPLMVPEVNAEHLGLLGHQRFAAAGGGILTNPNCSTIGLTLALKPLHDAFGLEAVHVVTMQAVSGAGLPGVPSMAITDNVIPFIGGEEDKLEQETLKILGRVATAGDQVDYAALRVSAACNRVPVIDGHTECVSVKLSRPASQDQVLAALEQFRGEPQRLGLPSAPARPIHLLSEKDRPQPRLDRNRDQGMATSVGRLRPCPLFDYKFVLLSHNTLRGAAGGSILVAELALAKGHFPGLTPPSA